MILEGELHKHVLSFEGARYRRHTKVDVDVDEFVRVCPQHSEPNHPTRTLIYMQINENMRVQSLLTKDIGGMSFLSEGFELIVAPAILPVAVPRMFHHLGHKMTGS